MIAILFYLLLIVSKAENLTILGNEKLRENSYKLVEGERIVVLSNPTGIYDDSLLHIVDDMHLNKNINLLAIFSPEHGMILNALIPS